MEYTKNYIQFEDSDTDILGTIATTLKISVIREHVKTFLNENDNVFDIEEFIEYLLDNGLDDDVGRFFIDDIIYVN